MNHIKAFISINKKMTEATALIMIIVQSIDLSSLKQKKLADQVRLPKSLLSLNYINYSDVHESIHFQKVSFIDFNSNSLYF